jgi:GNAT superfamily N-acetyltransferase
MEKSFKKYLIFETKKNEKIISTDVYTSKEFSEYVDNHNKSKRFYEFDRGGRFKYFLYTDFKNSYNTDPDSVRFFTVKENDLVVGLAHIEKSPYAENTYWLSYLSIDPKFENKGYASILSEFIFKWFKKHNLTFETSSYSSSGFIKLKPLFNKLSKKYNVNFIDKGEL